MDKDFNIILFHSRNDSYCDKSTTKFDHKKSLTIKLFGKDMNGPFSFPNERWMKNHMANEHRMKAVKEGGLLKVS